jgi:hypothetical protein
MKIDRKYAELKERVLNQMCASLDINGTIDPFHARMVPLIELGGLSTVKKCDLREMIALDILTEEESHFMLSSERVAFQVCEDMQHSTIGELVDEISTRVRTTIEEQVRQVILRVTDLDHLDIDREFAKRFPRVTRDVISYGKSQVESFYWNDGSDNGLKLITFTTTPSMNVGNLKVGFDIQSQLHV